MANNTSAAMKAEQGIVTIHARTMRVVMSHLVLVNLRSFIFSRKE
jgi:hypothetical protein